MSAAVLAAGLILLGVSLARHSLGLKEGKCLAAIAAVLGARWVWGLARRLADAGTVGGVAPLYSWNTFGTLSRRCPQRGAYKSL